MKQVDNVSLWFCDHCNKLYRVRHACTKHEKFCNRNPANRHPCFHYCIHLSKGEESDYDGYNKRTSFYCKIRKVELYSYIAERIGHPIIDYEEVDRMPLRCEHFEDDCESTVKDWDEWESERRGGG